MTRSFSILCLGILGLLLALSCYDSCSAKQVIKVESSGFDIEGISFRLVEGGTQPVAQIVNGFADYNLSPINASISDFFITRTVVSSRICPQIAESMSYLENREGRGLFSNFKTLLLLDHLQKTVKFIKNGQEIHGTFGIASTEEIQRAFCQDEFFSSQSNIDSEKWKNFHRFSNRFSETTQLSENYLEYPLAIGASDIRRGYLPSGYLEANIIGWPKRDDPRMFILNRRNGNYTDRSCSRFWPLDTTCASGYFYITIHF